MSNDLRNMNYIYPPDQARARYARTANAALSALDMMGIGKMGSAPGSEIPPSPEDVTNMSEAELGKSYDQFMQWHSYLSGIEIVYKSLVRQRVEYLEYVKAALRSDTEIKKLPKKDQDHAILLRQEYVESNADVVEHQSILDGVQIALKRVSKNMIQLSRHITLRDDDQGRFNRGESAGRSRNYSPRKGGPEE